MTIDRNLVLYLEKLGRIRLTEEERAACETELQSIIGYFDQLNSLDTCGVEPLSHSFPVANVMREDCTAPSMEPALLLSNAPQKKDNCFLVYRTVE
ncbi:MAG: Asp-tRNA(Asn)/Glu-tRNA(Gln) amidotransferase subunit GatC [Oscillospiraceae bacterium]|jgi:aspartyl-tRNA(Asn)/glutamyl-tRNA(Gln) amidotransferase subunit C|nr:Asp-tRNA(Asn)/Glu-tRNA(Gln) amidotransferase subunit GatC [Oscillospiraceae bacterium]